MAERRLINNTMKVLVLLLAAGLIAYFWRANLRPPPPVGGGDNDEDDVKYAPRVPVSVAPIGRGTLHDYVTAYGVVEPAPGAAGKAPAAAEIRLPVASLISELLCSEGQHVEQGQPLLKLDARQANADIDQSRRALAIANANFERFQQSAGNQKTGDTRPSDFKTGEQWLLQAQRDRDLAQADLDRQLARQSLLTVISPLSGTVVQLQIGPGETADASSPTLTVVDLSRLVIAVSVSGEKLKQIAVGQDANIILRSRSKSAAAALSKPATIVGKVNLIDAQIDPKTGLGSVDITLPEDTSLRLGDFVGVQIVTATHADRLTVPLTSVVRDVKGVPGISLVVRDFQWAFRHPVKVGLIEDDLIEVEGEGLQPGAFVVTTGAYALPDKSRIDVGEGARPVTVPATEPVPSQSSR